VPETAAPAPAPEGAPAQGETEDTMDFTSEEGQ
jgi:hypothetical protein